MTHSVGADAAKASLSGANGSVAPPARSLWASEPSVVAPRCAAPAGAALLDALQVGRSAAVAVPTAAAAAPAGRPPAGSAVLVGVASCARPRPLGEIVPATTPPVTIPLRLSIQPMAVDGSTSFGDLSTRCDPA